MTGNVRQLRFGEKTTQKPQQKRCLPHLDVYDSTATASDFTENLIFRSRTTRLPTGNTSFRTCLRLKETKGSYLHRNLLFSG